MQKNKQIGINERHFFKLPNEIASLPPPLITFHSNIYLCRFGWQQYYLFQALNSLVRYSKQSQRRLIPGVLLFPREKELIC